MDDRNSQFYSLLYSLYFDVLSTIRDVVWNISQSHFSSFYLLSSWKTCGQQSTFSVICIHFKLINLRNASCLWNNYGCDVTLPGLKCVQQRQQTTLIYLFMATFVNSMFQYILIHCILMGNIRVDEVQNDLCRQRTLQKQLPLRTARSQRVVSLWITSWRVIRCSCHMAACAPDTSGRPRWHAMRSPMVNSFPLKPCFHTAVNGMGAVNTIPDQGNSRIICEIQYVV
jgi:hypothetical protein